MPDGGDFLRLTPRRALGFAAVAVVVLGVVSLCHAPAVSLRAAARETASPVRLRTPHLHRPLRHIAAERAPSPHEARPSADLSELMLPSRLTFGAGRRGNGPAASDARTRQEVSRLVPALSTPQSHATTKAAEAEALAEAPRSRPWDYPDNSGGELSPRAKRQYPMRKNSGYYGRDSPFPDWLHRPLSSPSVFPAAAASLTPVSRASPSSSASLPPVLRRASRDGGASLRPVLTGTAWHYSAEATARAGNAATRGSLAQRCSEHGVWAAPLGRCAASLPSPSRFSSPWSLQPPNPHPTQQLRYLPLGCMPSPSSPECSEHGVWAAPLGRCAAPADPFNVTVNVSLTLTPSSTPTPHPSPPSCSEHGVWAPPLGRCALPAALPLPFLLTLVTPPRTPPYNCAPFHWGACPPPHPQYARSTCGPRR
jgi:hypothetical protein